MFEAIAIRPGRAPSLLFEDCAHAPIYENVNDFNRRTLAVLQRHS